MAERLLLTLLLLLGGAALYAGVHWWQRRRLGRLDAVAPTILYFRSASCAACAGQHHVLQRLLSLYAPRLQLRQIDTDREPDLARDYGVMTLPTTMVVDAAGAVRHINYGLADQRRLARQLETLL